MALKTTIGPRGVVTELIAGTQDQLVVDVEAPRETINTIISGAGVLSASGGTYMLLTPVSLTCSLPSINTANVGTHVIFLKDLNATAVLVTSSNSINGVATPVVMSSSYGVLDLVSVPSNPSGSLFHWHVLHSTLPV